MNTMNVFMRTFVCLMTISLAGFATFAVPTPSVDEFAQTNAAFDAAAARLARDPATAKAELAKLAAAYQRIATASPLSDRSYAEALFNAGLAYQLSDHMGDAVLAYRRAELTDSSIPGLAANLAKARSQISGQPSSGANINDAPNRPQAIIAALDQWRGGLWTIGLVAFVAIWVLLFVRLAANTLRFRVHASLPIAATLIALTCATAIAFPVWRIRQASINAAVVMTETAPRAGPDPVVFAAVPTGPLKAGSEIVIEETRAGGDGRTWVKARTRSSQLESQAFWLPENTVTLVSPPSAASQSRANTTSQPET